MRLETYRRKLPRLGRIATTDSLHMMVSARLKGVALTFFYASSNQASPSARFGRRFEINRVARAP